MAQNPLSEFTRNWITALTDPRRNLSALKIPAFLREFLRYRQLAEAEDPLWRDLYPCLADRVGRTPFDPHYFYQAGWLARRLSANPPVLHLDIGSSVSMMAVISGFAPSIFIDYRPLAAPLSALSCVAGDILQLPLANQSVRSLSCLHVIEHIGLGRYGDPLNIDGTAEAAREIVRVLAPGGRLFLSTPVGRSRTQFNAHRVLAVANVRAMFSSLDLVGGAVVNDDGMFIDGAHALSHLQEARFACGMFEFLCPTH